MRVLSLIANTSLAYPFFATGSLYCCWLLAGHVLGHTPIAWVDDPAITLQTGGVTWLYFMVTWLAILPAIPICVISTSCNIAYILQRRPSAAQVGIRLVTTTAAWLFLWVWVAKDSNEIIKWWMD